jgi:hypothetical protein
MFQTSAIAFTAIVIVGVSVLTFAQWPNAPQAPEPPQVAPPGSRQAPPPPQSGGVRQERPLEYAFRPELTNEEYGRCLKMEKHWKGLWQRYYDYYRQFAYASSQDPSYAQASYHLNQLKQELDAAWNAFSGQCVYFPARR